MAVSCDSDMGPSPIDDESTTLVEGEREDCSETKKREVSIVLAGKSGAGKSTLFKNLLDLDMEIHLSAKPITKVAERYSTTKNDVTLNITDTPGFVDAKVEDPQKKFDLLVFCVPVSPGCKFHDSNEDIMQQLQDMYGSDIWKHCVVVFTFGNCAWQWALEDAQQNEDTQRTEDAAMIKYKDYLEEYTEEFQKKLNSLKVQNVTIKTIFKAKKPYDDIILAIPAGKKKEDPVIPSSKWVDTIFHEMIEKCKSNVALAQYRYGRHRIRKVVRAVGTIGGATASAALLGAGIGAGTGVVGGPVGMAAGAGVGGFVGFVAGAGVSAVARKSFKKMKKK